MTRENTKEKILAHAALIIRQKGFNNTGIQELLRAAGVPKGSFYFYFKSKDDLGLALIDYYGEFFAALSESSLRNQEIPPLQRLEKFFEARRLLFEQDSSMSGCPIGNLAQEMGSLNDAFQAKLQRVLNGMQSAIRECVEQALERGEIHANLDPEETAHFILNSWEGALLRMKADRSSEPLVLFEKMVFGRVLKR